MTYIDHSEDVLKGHVSKEEEERAVDVGDALLSETLPEVDDADEQSDSLRNIKMVVMILSCGDVVWGVRTVMWY